MPTLRGCRSQVCNRGGREVKEDRKEGRKKERKKGGRGNKDWKRIEKRRKDATNEAKEGRKDERLKGSKERKELARKGRKSRR